MHNTAIIPRSLLAASLAVSMLHPAAAMADGGLHTSEAGGTLTDSFMGSAHKQGWDVSVGGGLAYLPTFEGSDRYTTTLVPFVHVAWNDWISIGTNGLSAYWRHDASSTRKESKSLPVPGNAMRLGPVGVVVQPAATSANASKGRILRFMAIT